MTTIYPQAKPFIADDLAVFLERPLIAKLCSHNPDGTIHVAPMWFRYQDGDVLLGTQEITHKVRNIQGNNQVTLLIDTTEPTLQGVIMVGEAELDYDDVITKRVSIFEKYVDDPQGLAERLASSWTPVIIRVKPRSMTTYDYSQGFGLSQASDGPDVFD